MGTLKAVYARITGRITFQDPPVARFLFASGDAAWLWLAARLWLGWQWFEAGREKVGNPAWMDIGAAAKGFWERAVAVPATGRPSPTTGTVTSFSSCWTAATTFGLQSSSSSEKSPSALRSCSASS
jgi:hypothetical protein